MAEKDLIGKELGERLADLVGMRNILVHGYLEVQLEIIHNTIPLVVEDAQEFVRQILAVLEEHS